MNHSDFVWVDVIDPDHDRRVNQIQVDLRREPLVTSVARILTSPPFVDSLGSRTSTEVVEVSVRWADGHMTAFRLADLAKKVAEKIMDDVVAASAQCEGDEPSYYERSPNTGNPGVQVHPTEKEQP